MPPRGSPLRGGSIAYEPLLRTRILPGIRQRQNSGFQGIELLRCAAGGIVNGLARVIGLALGIAAVVIIAVACAQEPAETREPAPPRPVPVSQPPAAPLPSVTLPPELARVLHDYEEAWRARDAAALARLFAEDGFVLPNGGMPVRGRAAIEQSYAGHGGPLALRAIAYATHGSTGYIIGGYAPRAGDEDTGKFTLTLRRGDDGRWSIVSDMDNSNRPQR